MQIPSLPKYDITRLGKVTSIETGIPVEERRNSAGLRSVIIHHKGHKQTKVLARLMLQTFCPLENGLSDDWLSIKYLDGNKDNIRLTNLEWNSSIYTPEIIPGITHPVDTWVPVPDYNNFEIRLLNGIEFRNPNTGNIYPTALNSSGYLSVMAPDGKYHLVHRLVALMFLPHPDDFQHLTVNHKDTNRLNNSLSNLEWVTQSENNQYAKAINGSRSKYRRVVMQSLEDYTITGYPSIHDAARFLDTNPGNIHALCSHRQRRGLGYKGFLIKFEDDQTPWSEMRKDVDKNQEPYRIAVKDMLSGKVVVYDSLMETVKGEYINPKTVYRLLWSKIMIPWNGKCLQTYKEDMTWPNYPPEIVKAYIRVQTGARPFKVTYPDGQIEYSAGASEWCKNHKEYNPKLAVLNRAINRDGEWNGIKFEYIDLNDYQ